MAKRSSLFGSAAPAAAAPKAVPGDVMVADPPAVAMPPSTARKYPVAKTREGKRVATVYLEREALKQLSRIALDEDTTVQALLVEGVNAVFQSRGLSRIG